MCIIYSPGSDTEPLAFCLHLLPASLHCSVEGNLTLHLTGLKASFLCSLEPSSHVPQLAHRYRLFFRIWSLAAYHPIAQFLSKPLTYVLTHVVSIQHYHAPHIFVPSVTPLSQGLM